MKYKITWTEIKSGEVFVEADTELEAKQKWENKEYNSLDDFSEVRYDDVEVEGDD